MGDWSCSQVSDRLGWVACECLRVVVGAVGSCMRRCVCRIALKS